MKASSIRPITDLKNRTKQLVQEVSETGQSVMITQNGKPRVVVMGVEEHDRLNDTLSMLKLLAHGLEVQRQGGKRYSTAEVRKLAHAALAPAKEG